MIKITASGRPNELLRKAAALSGQDLFACYQCGTCSAGCPMVAEMDLLPDQLIRHVLFGMSDALESTAIWVCASCYLCDERCPRGIDVSKIMEALRQIWLRQNEDYVHVAQLPKETLAELPPIALVANFRKNTG